MPRLRRRKYIFLEFQKVLILAGLEPAIPWFVVRCLIHWATRPYTRDAALSCSSISPICNMKCNQPTNQPKLDMLQLQWTDQNTSECPIANIAFVFVLIFPAIEENKCHQKPILWVIIFQHSSHDCTSCFYSSFRCKIGCNELCCMAEMWLVQFDGRVAHW